MLAPASTPNRANAIQCEIVWRAGDIRNLPTETLRHVVDWVTWVAEQTGTPLTVCPQGFHGPNQGIVLASESSPVRFGDDEWLDFSGICGHQHVPSGNDHWDPGAFPVHAFDNSTNNLINREEDDMFTDDDRNALAHVRTVLDELKRELSQAAGTDNWHEVGERLQEKLA